MEILKRIAAFFLDAIETIVVGLSLFVVCYLFLFQVHQVRGASMEPNFHDQEHILTDKISYRFKLPERGDVIVFRAPKNRELDYIKRVIALPGERLKIAGGKIYINDQELKENYLSAPNITSSGSFLPSGKEFVIPEGQYLVFGDNRPYSSDSREWGTVDRQDIIGRVLIRLWPPQNFGALAKIKY